MDNEQTSPEDQGKDITPKGSSRGGNPPLEYRFKPGVSGNPAGRKTAGATVREQINSLAEQDLTEDELRRIARDKRLSWSRRTAAERMLRTLEAGDLADFAGLLRGENNIEDLRGMGINTEVVKKLKQKTRKITHGRGEDQEVEEIVEREIELHDRAGDDFDRVVNTTDGSPRQTIDTNLNASLSHVTDEELLRLCNELGMPLPPGLERRE